MSYENFKSFLQRNLLYTYSAGGAIPAAPGYTPVSDDGYGASEIGMGLEIKFCMGKQPVHQPEMLSRLGKR